MWICPVQGPPMGMKCFSFSETPSALLIPCLPLCPAGSLPALAAPGPAHTQLLNGVSLPEQSSVGRGVPAPATPQPPRATAPRKGFPGPVPVPVPCGSTTAGHSAVAAPARWPRPLSPSPCTPGQVQQGLSCFGGSWQCRCTRAHSVSRSEGSSVS